MCGTAMAFSLVSALPGPASATNQIFQFERFKYEMPTLPTPSKPGGHHNWGVKLQQAPSASGPGHVKVFSYYNGIIKRHQAGTRSGPHRNITRFGWKAQYKSLQ